VGSRKVFALARFLRGFDAPGMGGGVSCNETWGGLAGGKVSNVVRKEEERSDGVMMSDAVLVLVWYWLNAQAHPKIRVSLGNSPSARCARPRTSTVVGFAPPGVSLIFGVAFRSSVFYSRRGRR